MNTLIDCYPNLLEEWDYEKNIISPKKLSYGSARKVWWRCKEGHSWQATPNSRSYNKTGCPYCSKRTLLEKIIKNKILVETYFELMQEWDYEKNTLKPNEVSHGSNKKAWWKCKKGHSWETSINSRTYKKTGCPYCSGRSITKEKSLVVTHSILLEEWDYEKNVIKPEEISYGSNKKVWWKCKNGHSWKTMVSNRAINKTGCKKCKK